MTATTGTIWRVARRPRWIAALALALIVAAGFAALSQWQLARSISTGTVVQTDTERVVALTTVARPQSQITSKANTQRVSVTGEWARGDFSIISDRLNDGDSGYWVVGHFRAVTKADAATSAGAATSATSTSGGSVAGLAVALGWSKTRAEAASAVSTLGDTLPKAMQTIVGRYLPTEAAEESDFQHGKTTTVSPAQLINVWKTTDAAGVYGGYLVLSAHPAGLVLIDAPRPVNSVELNLLNIFYAIEWIVFAGFAIFLWYRLVKDAWERENEQELENELAELTQVN